MHVEVHPQKGQRGPLGRVYPLGALKLRFRASPPWKSDSAMPRRAAKLASSENELGIPRGSPKLWVGRKAWPHTWAHLPLGVSAAQPPQSDQEVSPSSSLVRD